MIALDILKDNGYKVYISHSRYYPKILSPLLEKDAKDEGYSLSQCEPRGGLTEVEIHDMSKKVTLIGSGSALCSIHDGYCKKIGRTIALGRAIKNMCIFLDSKSKSTLNIEK